MRQVHRPVGMEVALISVGLQNLSVRAEKHKSIVGCTHTVTQYQAWPANFESHAKITSEMHGR